MIMIDTIDNIAVILYSILIIIVAYTLIIIASVCYLAYVATSKIIAWLKGRGG